MRRIPRLFAAASALSLLMAPGAAPAQLFLDAPDFTGAQVTGSEPGLGLPLPGATPAEYSAALIWNLRAGLNVAALQCHTTPFLDTTANYNAMLVNHSDELKPAYETLTGYFKRTAGSLKAFDDYNTKTYNGFSTLYAQQGFCHTAASIGRAVLFAPRVTGLITVARQRMREFRNSLVPAGDRMFSNRVLFIPSAGLTDYPAKCYRRDGSLKSGCAN